MGMPLKKNAPGTGRINGPEVPSYKSMLCRTNRLGSIIRSKSHILMYAYFPVG